MSVFSLCPKCGSNEHNGQVGPFICDRCGFTFFQNTAAAVAGIIEVDDHLLFTRRAKSPGKGLLDLPGGFVDADEGLEQGLSREVQEELGIDITQWQYLCSFPNTYHYKDIDYKTSDAIYYCRLPTLPNCRLQEGEIAQVLWVHRDAVDVSQMAFESLQLAVNQYLKATKS